MPADDASMNGETHLRTLLASMKPVLHTGDYVFCVAPGSAKINHNDIVATFREEEGVTLILEKSKADELNLRYYFVAAWITLTVHSSLDAVGLTAAVSTALAQRGVSCNVVAAFYHDHIFVKRSDAATALEILNHLSL